MSRRNAVSRITINILYEYSPVATILRTEMALNLQNPMAAQEFVQLVLAAI